MAKGYQLTAISHQLSANNPILTIKLTYMKIKYLSVLALGLLLLPAGRALGQEVLTLRAAVRYALAHKAEARKAGLDLANAQNLIDEARANALPQVNVSAGMTYNAIIQKVALDGALAGMPGTTILMEMGQKWQSTPVVSLSQQLFNQTVFTGLKAARTTREFYRINEELTEEQLIERVANAYYGVYQTRQQMETVRTNLASTERTHGVVSGLHDAGLARKIDLDRTAVAINNLKATEQQLQNALDLQENALKFAIGMDIALPIALPEETFEMDGAILAEVDGVDGRTELRALRKQLELLDLNRKAMESQYYPTLSLSANYGYVGYGGRLPVFSSHPSVSWSNFSGISLNLAFPVFNGFATRAKIRQAKVDIQKAQLDMEDARLALSLGNENAKAQVRNSLLTVRTNRENVQLARDVLADTQNNYRTGLATLTDLLDAERAYADAQNNLTTSLLGYKVAEVQLIKANGNLRSLAEE